MEMASPQYCLTWPNHMHTPIKHDFIVGPYTFELVDFQYLGINRNQEQDQLGESFIFLTK